MNDATQADEGLAEFRPYRKLLVVCVPDKDNEETFTAATALAKTWGASVSVLAVIEPLPDINRISRATGASREEILSRIMNDHRTETLATLGRTGPEIRPTIDVRIGKPFIEIVRYVLDHDIDIVIKSAEELHGLHRHLFASTDQHLLRKCPCPVWLRRRGGLDSVRTILAAVDVDVAAAAEPETLTGLNRRILETATRIAASGDDESRVCVLHAWDAPGEGLIRTWSGAAGAHKAATAYVDEVQSAHWRALDRLVEHARTWAGPDISKRVKFVPLLERGEARDIIPAHVDTLKADTLVMGTIARSGVPGFIIGNTAEDILNSVDCSVATVKPPDYVSPLHVDDR
ncbi:MAG: universal stress protein [Alphaproteobacteria bacterium]